MTKNQTQRVVFQPTTRSSLQRGIEQIANTIRPTLGPLPRFVAIEQPLSSRAPELLDNGGVIARRILELPDRDEDMGAMLLRNLLLRVNEQVGDGTATAAVLFQSIYDQGVHYIASGGNAMRLRHYLEESSAVIRDALDNMTIHRLGKEHLAQVAESICHDPPLAKVLGEIFDIIGEHGHLEIVDGRSRELEREYSEGTYWKSGVHSYYMLPGHKQPVWLEEAAILISDLEIDDPFQLVPVLETLIKFEFRALVIMAAKLSESALTLLINQKPETLRVIAVKAPGTSAEDRAANLEDLAVITGGRPILKAAGETLAGGTLEDLGHVRRAWADSSRFGVVGGKGDPRALRSHIMSLRTSFQQAEDPATRRNLRERIGRLRGGVATLWVGGPTITEVRARKELATRTADAIRGAQGGLLPGGGTALLACRPILQDRYKHSDDPDERAAYHIMMNAVDEPIRAIIHNAGGDVGQVMADIIQAGVGYGFDVRSGEVVHMATAGILDVASNLHAVLQSTINSAALALTVDVLVHPKKPKTAFKG
jgi:chaperonin GroEL